MNTLFSLLTAVYMNPYPDALICVQRGYDWRPETPATVAREYCPPNTEAFGRIVDAQKHRNRYLKDAQYTYQWVELYIAKQRNER